MRKGISIIRGEHKSLATVLRGLQYLVCQVARDNATPNLPVLHAMIDYVIRFPVRLHHPKENEYLFSRLRARAPDIVPLLDRLEQEHVEDAKMARDLKETLVRCEQSGGGYQGFADAVEHYAEFQWTHMRTEENMVLPAAEKLLADDDWEEIDAAFESNDDPLVGVETSEEFRELYQRILTLAPVPVGLGRS